MRFELTDDQRAIQETARDFLGARYPAEEIRRLAFEDERGFTDAQWQAIAELGWPALVVAEDDGGLGLGVVELTVLMEQLGHALAPAPLLSSVAVALVLGAAGDDAQRAE
jgi:alkylation response protein AidB-like acyl-CoA dehydrogenase